jgi:hypothetical protein
MKHWADTLLCHVNFSQSTVDGGRDCRREAMVAAASIG